MENFFDELFPDQSHRDHLLNSFERDMGKKYSSQKLEAKLVQLNRDSSTYGDAVHVLTEPGHLRLLKEINETAVRTKDAAGALASREPVLEERRAAEQQAFEEKVQQNFKELVEKNRESSEQMIQAFDEQIRSFSSVEKDHRENEKKEEK